MSSRHRDRDREASHKDRDRYHSERERERDRAREHSRYDSRHDSRGDRQEHRSDSRYDSKHDNRHDSRRHDSREPERTRDKDRRRRSRSKDRKDKDREKDKHKSRDRSRDRLKQESPGADESSRKRHKTDNDRQQKQQPQQQQQPQQPELTAEEREAAHKKQREDEQKALDAEMEERRKRVEEWRRKRAAEAAAAELERKQQEEAEAAAQNNKGWSLEDDDDDEHEQQQDDKEDEVDPLDAFTEGNAAAVAPEESDSKQQLDQQQEQQQQQQATDVDMAEGSQDQAAIEAEEPAPEQQQEEDDDIDPLDAFMAAEVMPEVAKVRWSEPATAAGAANGAGQEAAAVDQVAAGAIAAADSSRPASKAAPSSGKRVTSSKARSQVRRYYGSSESSEDFTDSEADAEVEEEEQDDATWAKAVTAGKLSKGEKLMAVDHSTIDYPPFRRNFYIEIPEIRRLDEAETAALRKELDGIKVRGKNPPKPIRTWTQAGISARVLDLLRKSGCEQPLPIQAQALPIIMSGRDCIGIAKTGSGKTLAFVIPMLRHIKDQPPLANGDGPVALIMAPTRELVQQISKEVKKLGRAVGLTSVAVFGGSGVANQISELKRGTEVVAATPGRLIDLLVSGGGKITNLRRVTYLVLDEADRMFDMGFEPQIMRIVGNIRPDRQTVMFSATFPRAVETLARQVLQDPVEIQVGGRSVVNSDIAQFVEIRPESDRYLRLLEILGEWYEKGKIIIFVHTQDKCDNLFRDLLKSGYPCLSLHGGKEQSDRECTITDFKGAVCNILVATSVAARGLDVRELVLVVNYDVPNHHEDYVHRVGRTGRAGNKGTAITFIGPDEDRYAPDLVKALKESKAAVPQDLQALADAFAAKRKAGLVQGHGSGYGGSGFKFDKEEDNKIKAARKSKAKEFGIVVDEEDDEDKANKSDDDDDIRPTMLQPTAVPGAVPGTLPGTLPAAAANGLPAVAMSAAAPVVQNPATAAMLAAAAAAGATPVVPPAAAAVPKFMPAQPGQQYPGQAVPQTAQSLVEAARLAAERAAAAVTGQTTPAAAASGAGAASLAAAQAAAMRAAALAAAFAQGGGAAAAVTTQQQQPQPGFESEMVINDFPQNARWKVTHKGFQAEITELTGAAVTTKGIYIAKGEPPEGERKLYLLIEAPTEAQVRRAKQEIRRVIEEHVEKAMRKDTGAAGRYNIM